MLGEKVAITSPRPQTTRNRIPGVLTQPGHQLIFIDTPGIHRANRALNTYMNDVATEATWDTDCVALLVEAGVGPELEVGIAEVLEQLLEGMKGREKPAILVLNKIDRLPKEHLLPIIEKWRHAYGFEAIVPISALTGDGVDVLMEEFVKLLPEGPPLYPADALTDLPERFIAAELVREKLFRTLQRELPYSIAVTVESWKDRHSDNLVEIEVVIHVERESQKGIVIGKGGRTIKKVGTEARKDLEKLLGTRVYLRPFVRVERAWTRSPESLKKFGYE